MSEVHHGRRIMRGLLEGVRYVLGMRCGGLLAGKYVWFKRYNFRPFVRSGFWWEIVRRSIVRFEMIRLIDEIRRDEKEWSFFFIKICINLKLKVCLSMNPIMQPIQRFCMLLEALKFLYPVDFCVIMLIRACEFSFNSTFISFKSLWQTWCATRSWWRPMNQTSEMCFYRLGF